jgi:hypothetical protein
MIKTTIGSIVAGVILSVNSIYATDQYSAIKNPSSPISTMPLIGGVAREEEVQGANYFGRNQSSFDARTGTEEVYQEEARVVATAYPLYSEPAPEKKTYVQPGKGTPFYTQFFQQKKRHTNQRNTGRI